MIVQFEKNGKTHSGQVVARGFYNVDKPECFEIEISPYKTVIIPVADCKVR